MTGGAPVFAYPQPIYQQPQPVYQPPRPTAPRPQAQVVRPAPQPKVFRGQTPEEPRKLEMPAPEALGVPLRAPIVMPSPEALGVK